MADRAAYASDPSQSRGRLFDPGTSPTRSEFQRDRDRIIHSTAFRRLQHKTQVFLHHEGQHFRTRLTHTLEVSQMARSIARALALDEDLAEAVALAHDLGHTPFGHAGERALDRILRHAGGFDHNAQALRIVADLERRYADFDGLNLTWETLEGLVKHNGPLMARDGAPTARYAEHGVPKPILAYNRRDDLELWSQASAEAQIAAVADDIAYDAHDIDDGLRADLFTLGDLSSVPFLGGIVREIEDRYRSLEPARRVHEVTRRVITRMIEDVIAESERRIAALGAQSLADIRNAPGPVVGLSAAMTEVDDAIKGFLYPRMYRHHRVMRVMHDAEGVVADLFLHFSASPRDLPEEWCEGFAALDATGKERRIADYIAGMTDRYALSEHARFFKTTPELR